MNRLRCLITILLFVFMTPLTGFAAVNQWSGSGPFATGLGNRVITAMGISDDGAALYAGTGSGTVLSLNGPVQLITVTKAGYGSGTVAADSCTFDWSGSSGSCTTANSTAVTLSATPDAGSSFSGWSGGSGAATSCTGTGNCAFTATQDATVTATFTLNSYSVTPAAVTNGTIAPDSPQSVTYGSTTQFKLTPDPHYHIASVSGCNGTLSGSTYTTGVFPGDCTVTATFAIDAFTVTPSAGSNGSISPGSAQTVAYGGSTSFTVKPNAGYNIVTLTGCNGSYSGSLTDPVNGVIYTTGAITANCTVSAVFSNYAPSTDGLVAWWQGQDNAVDSMGGHDGTPANTTYAAGKVGNAFSFDNSACSVSSTASCGSVTIPDDSAFAFAAAPFTISAWVRIASGSGGYGTIFDRSQSGNNVGYRLDYAPDSHTFRLLGTTSLSAAYTLTPGIWYHVAAVSTNGADSAIYVNGVAIATGTHANTNYAVAPRIGDCQTTGEAPFNGRIDELQIYNRALSATEIQSAYNQLAGFYDVTITSGASANGGWSGGSPDVWSPLNSGATVSASEILSRLNSGIGVTISTVSTGSFGTEHGDVTIDAPLAWSANQLKLSANRDLNIREVMGATGTSTLDLTATSGTVKTAGNGRVDFDRSGSSILTLNGADTTVITDAAALQAIGSALATNYAMGATIDASSIANFVPLGDATTPFTGIFDGLGHTISGLTISRATTNYVGLFGYTTGATLRNVGLVGGSVGGQYYVGSLAGQNDGSILNSYATGSVTGSGNYVGGLVGWNHSGRIDNCFSSGAVSGGMYVGGLVGENYLDVTISNSYNSGAVHGSSEVGGLAGYNWGSYTNVYSSGAVSATTGTHVGGLLGGSGAGTVTNGFWDTSVNSALTDNGLGSAKSTAEMKTLATFSSWDISATAGNGTTWRIYEGQSYPLLRSFLKPLTVTANDDSEPYNGGTSFSGNGVTYTPSAPDMAALTGTLTFTAGSASVGTTTLTPGGLASFNPGYDISYVNGTLTIIATYVVTYDGNANTSGSAPTDATAYLPGATVTVLGNTGSLVKSGYSFTGWNTAANGSGTSYAPGATFSITANTILYAQWVFQRNVSVTLTGTGAGGVYSVPAAIACTSGTCTHLFDDASAVTLTAAPDSNSTFGGWSGDCSNSTGNCELTMTVDKAVTATLTAAPRAMVGTNGHATLTGAYAATTSGATIKARSVTFTENLILDQIRSIQLKGGYNAPYDCNTCGEHTLLEGTLTVKKGSVVIENLTIK
ncbi:InlB B-repeat-containing protein [Trichlorobacter lovleyi]|uniref:LamG-like jellyroll fold domain-containing protein n=1 Tax=Trichlorobacter lovleyi TaxID=313985 RepID=UPI00223FE864|nr:LamG-like jellyroll fold domain-containing protein [Trichlorobacter lovleyi]QOX77967.1 InlB B-repeat-containing protein [Trichlorobacter lovleyi]